MYCGCQKKKECPICYQHKRKYLKCQICSDTNICLACIDDLCERGMCDKCPVCRQSNWKKNVILENRNQIENNKINYLLNFSHKLYRFLNTVVIVFKIIIYIGTLLIILYILGLFTLFVLNPSLNLEYQGYKYWLPLLIGLAWLLVIMSPCCCGKNLNQIYFTDY